MTTTAWNPILREQLTFHWDSQVRERLAGLTDDEYLWKPAPDCWSVRPDARSGRAGVMTIDFALPQPDPPPLTTIAWRLGHVIVGVLAIRNAAHFGREPVDYASFPYAATADQALAQLDAEYAAWLAGVEALGEDGLLRPVGEAEGPHAASPYTVLVLHIHREMIHHLAEVALLRDLYTHTHDQAGS